jgi:hypothetical protein
MAHDPNKRMNCDYSGKEIDLVESIVVFVLIHEIFPNYYFTLISKSHSHVSLSHSPPALMQLKIFTFSL